MFGSRQGILVTKKCRKCQELSTAGFGLRQEIPGRDRVLFWLCVVTGIPVSQHDSQILSNRTCRNMALFVATGF